jgi:hypothetical protein
MHELPPEHWSRLLELEPSRAEPRFGYMQEH